MTPPKHILVVDDEIDIRTCVTYLLTKRGYRVHAVESADEALKYINDKNLVDLFILDIMMPGMTGLGFLRELRGPMGSRTPVILLTARSSTADIGEGYNRGAEFYLTKPFEPETLVNAVDYLIRDLTPEEQSLLEVKLFTSDNIYYGLRTITYH